MSSLAEAYHTVGKGVGEIKNAAMDAFGDVVENELGPEARDIGGAVVTSVGNFGGAVAQVAEVGTGAVLVSGGVQGAIGLNEVNGDTEPASDSTSEDDSSALVRPPAEEMTTFVIEEKDEDGEWKDVSI